MDSIDLAKKIRIHSIKMAHYAKESHIASALSVSDIVAVLYNDILKVSAKKPCDGNRDRFILSKGHACSAVYAALAEKGFFDIEELYHQCKNGAKLGGHITNKSVSGVEISTGSLGHGCCVAAGVALAGKLKNKAYNVYVIVGDGECNEGSVWEMAQFAYQRKLDNLTIIVDHNKMQALGSCRDILDFVNLSDKWKSFGWNTIEVDGHNHKELKAALLKKADNNWPKCIIAHTIKGKGISFMENNIVWHYRDPQGKEYAEALAELGESI